MNPETTPVIVGVGESLDRPEELAAALEPVALMERAVRAAEVDCGARVLPLIQSVELIGLVSWRYKDPVSLLCERLELEPARKRNASMGGDTPVRLIHEAAVRIAKGELSATAIVGGESLHTRNRARKQNGTLKWTALASREEAARFDADTIGVSDISKRLNTTDPAHLYPLYEMAAEAAWGQTPAQGSAESAALWAQFATVAAGNPNAWIRTAPDARTIQTPDQENRLVCWPYPKLMVANPSVNQAAAVIVMSVAAARRAGVPEERMLHIWGGAAATDPENYLQRDTYERSAAQSAVLARAVEIAGGSARQFDKLELYSCFPIVPKLALRTLGLDPAACAPTVTGGLTFFGGPLNNYMTHAVCAMTRTLRASRGELGLLYAQGGVLTKHHALVVSTRPPETSLPLSYSVQSAAEALRGPVPELVESYRGAARIETYTVLYGRDGEPIQGIVVLRTTGNQRTMARVLRDDRVSLDRLTSTDRSAIGEIGHVRVDVFGKPVWEAGALRERSTLKRRYAHVERDGPITLVTINRPESLNSLHPPANAELAEIFDEFAADPDAWVAILTGAGERAFSSGNDLKFTASAMARGEPLESPLTGFAGLTGRFDLCKPVIAAVNGIAMGGGFEIALACDLIVAADTAVFALPEPKVGLAALEGGLLRLPAQIGSKQAMGIILTSRRVSATEGLQMGFVNEVTKPAQLLDTAREWARRILEGSPMAIRAAKQIAEQGATEASLEQAYRHQHGYPAVRALMRSADLREGPRAFAEKRAPKWQGK